MEQVYDAVERISSDREQFGSTLCVWVLVDGVKLTQPLPARNINTTFVSGFDLQQTPAITLTEGFSNTTLGELGFLSFTRIRVQVQANASSLPQQTTSATALPCGPTETTPQPAATTGSDRDDTALLAGIAVLGSLLLVSLITLIVMCCRNRRHRANDLADKHAADSTSAYTLGHVSGIGAGGGSNGPTAEQKHSQDLLKHPATMQSVARREFSDLILDSRLLQTTSSPSAGDLPLLERLPGSVRLHSRDKLGDPFDLWRGAFVENYLPLFVKRANPRYLRSTRAMLDLLLEAQLMTMLDTKYSATCYGFMWTQRHGYSLLYEHSTGGTMRMVAKRLDKDGAFGNYVHAMLTAFAHVAEAIQYLHDSDIVHCSLSADAVYVSSSFAKPKLAGFTPRSLAIHEAELLVPPTQPRIKWCVMQKHKIKERERERE